MKLLTFLFLTIFTISPFFLTKPEVFAKEAESFAKCRMPSFNEAYRGSKVIFAGKVLSERVEGDERIFTIQVEKYWKGTKSKMFEVRYYETMRYQSWLKVGGRYLVFANGNENGTLSDGRCSLTKDYSQASAELKRLGKGKVVK